MVKITIILILFISNIQAMDFTIIEITSEPAFNHFASLNLWLLIISSPMFLLFSLIKYAKKSF